MGAEARVAGARHHGAEEHGLEAVAIVFGVVGEVPVRLAEGGDDLRHLQPEHALGVGERGAVALRVALVALGGVRPDLDADAGERSTVAGTPHAAGHPKTPAADALDDRGTGLVVVGTPAHGRGRGEALRAHRPQEADGAGRQGSAGSGGPGQEQGAA